ncbi:MAG TPA: SIMPL domain-containing protein [Catenuloplanes sp.]|jgi:hypothetical protein
MVDAPVVLVRGEAFREVAPEIARFAVTVSARDRDRQATLTRLAERSAAVRALLDGYGEVIERRETGGVHVRPEMKRSGERVVAYTGSVSTTVTVADFTVLGELIMKLADTDQATVAGPWWELRPGSTAHREVRRAAITEAIERAREYADAVGARLERLQEIADDASGGGGMQLRSMAAGAYDLGGPGGAPELDLDPQQQVVQAAVRVRFSISEPATLG